MQPTNEKKHCGDGDNTIEVCIDQDGKSLLSNFSYHADLDGIVPEWLYPLFETTYEFDLDVGIGKLEKNKGIMEDD